MPRTRSSASLCRKIAKKEAPGQCDDCSHIKMIANLKREVVELKTTLDLERGRHEAFRERTAALHSARLGGEEAVSLNGISAQVDLSDSHKHTLYELELCKKELGDTRESLREACEEQECLRIRLSASKTDERREAGGETHAEDPHPRLDWVGRHYLAVALPEEYMFKPGQSVTSVGVLQKLFEMRVRDKQATGFSVLLENINIMLSQLEPEWYATHFAFRRAYVYGNKYKSTDRVDIEDFAWLLFEYGAHAPLIEVLVGLLNVQNSTGKGGVTTAALYTSKNMYSAYVTLFRDTVSRAAGRFTCVRERAQRVRKALGSVYVPLTAGLVADQNNSQVSQSVRSRVLRSVMEGIEAPSRSAAASAETDRVHREDPLGLGQSISAFMNHRGLDDQGNKKKRTLQSPINQEDLPFRAVAVGSDMSSAPLEKRVLFDSPWSNDLAL